jgi:hypothetical protein
VFIALALLFAAGGSAVAAGLSCKGQQGSLAFPYPSYVPAGWEHDRFGTEPREMMVVSGSFVSAFAAGEDAAAGSPYRGLPRWVAYEMRALRDADGRAIHPVGAKRPVRWYELSETRFLWDGQPGIVHAGIDPAYRGQATTWNRGHIAARSHADRLGWEEGCNSHVFVNALPQHARLNQGDWQALENYAAALANHYGRVWTIAGPVFEPGRPVERIGEPGEVSVPIPHALFKILAIETGGRVEARGFLFPQADDSDWAGYRRCSATAQDSYDFSRFAVGLGRIESAAALHLFTRLAGEARAVLLGGSAASLWPVGPEDFTDRCGPHMMVAGERPAP